MDSTTKLYGPAGGQGNDGYERGEVAVVSPIQKLFQALKYYLLTPFLMGFSGAFGISVGMFGFAAS